ncbi:MAG: polysaccharide export protein [Novosphingobium sp.]|nr:polysaccharide export protein [Novosphingobium sp.]
MAESSPAEDYRLGPGDKLQLIVYGEQNLTSEQLVAADGSVTVPLAGRVVAEGKTSHEVAAEIQTRLADGFLRNPAVVAVVTAYRPFYILGEVNNPGQYEYAVGMTARDAVAKAGGYTYRAKKNEIVLRHEKTTEEVRVILDQDFRIRPGDTLRIDERYF